MRKLLLLTAITAVFQSSCSEDDFTTQSTIDVNTIAFATNKAMTSTRSAETITSINKFIVSAVNNDNTTYYSNEDYIYDSGSRTFKSSTPHYWPTTGTLSFYAISDAGSYAVDANNVPQFSYTNWPAEKDLVAATVLAGEKQNPYPLNFKHLTSQILVSAEAQDKTQEMTYKLVSVKLITPSTGEYHFADATGGVGTWTIDNTSTSEYSYSTALPRTFKQNGQVALSSCYWNILPVTDGTMSFVIEYQVLQNGKIITDNTGVNAKTCTIDSPNLEAGKRYNYNFQLAVGSHEEIAFSVYIADWSDPANTDTTPDEVPEVESFELYSSVLYMSPEETFQLTVKSVTPSNASKEVTWSSSNPSVVSVDENGVLTCCSLTGTQSSIITATTPNGISRTCTVYVTTENILH